MSQERTDWRLPKGWLWLIVVPFLAFFLTNLILVKWGDASLAVAEPRIADGHAEAAGRIRTHATFLIFCTGALAASAYSLFILKSLSRRAASNIVYAWLGTMAAGIAVAFALGLHEGNTYLDRGLPCASFDFLHQAGAGTSPAVLAKEPEPLRSKAEYLPCKTLSSAQVQQLPIYQQGWTWFDVPPRRYDKDGFRTLRIMYAISAILLFLSMPAVIWAAIACLALPETGSARERHESWTTQTARLNRLLYITAGFMVAGLLFTSARLSWPGYSLHPDSLKSFAEHVSSIVLYTGVSNSILIASYYLPVAILLAARQPKRPPVFTAAAGAKDEPGPKAPDPFGALKTAATILSPALVALIGELVKFTG